MFKLANVFTVGTPIHWFDFNCSTPQSLGIVIDGQNQNYNFIPNDGSAISSKGSYLYMKLDVKHKAAGNNL